MTANSIMKRSIPMKKHKEKIKIGIVIGVFSVVIIACLVSIFSQVFTEYKENESFKNLA